MHALKVSLVTLLVTYKVTIMKRLSLITIYQKSQIHCHIIIETKAFVKILIIALIAWHQKSKKIDHTKLNMARKIFKIIKHKYKNLLEYDSKYKSWWIGNILWIWESVYYMTNHWRKEMHPVSSDLRLQKFLMAIVVLQ